MNKQKGTKRLKPISLYPLSLEEAIEAFMKTRPQKIAKIKKTKKRTESNRKRKRLI